MTINHSKSANNSEDANRFFLSVRSGENSEITNLYNTYRNTFIAFALKNFSVDKDTAIDIYQDSFTALFQAVKSGKLIKLTVSLKTYLFQIGKFKLLNYLRDKKEINKTDISSIPEPALDFDIEDWNKKKEITYQMVVEMGEPCSKVLGLFYWRQKSMKEIADEMNYKNEQVAKNKKHSCIQSLKEKLREKLKKEGLM